MALPFGEGGPLAVGEVIASSVKKWLKTPLFATFPRGEGFGPSWACIV